jgi:hypothetical protein
MKEEYKEFIGIYDESVPIELCNEFVENYEEAKKNRTIIDLTKENDTGLFDGGSQNELEREDESMMVTPLSSSIYPRPPVLSYFKFLEECFRCYIKKYNFRFNGQISTDVFKIHKVKKSEGYHSWHYESAAPHNINRIATYMTYLEAPTKGGETEFLHQSIRVEPTIGRTLIWPAGFTHLHRGNPPIEGEKMYITGWFTGESALPTQY